MPAPILVALVVAASCLSASGLLLSRRARVRLCGIFLAVTGAATGAAVLAFLSTHDMLGARLLVLAGLLLLPSAVLCYPYVVVGDPVELLCAVVVLGVDHDALRMRLGAADRLEEQLGVEAGVFEDEDPKGFRRAGPRPVTPHGAWLSGSPAAAR